MTIFGPFISANDVLAGAELGTSAGTVFATTDSSYEEIGVTIGTLFGSTPTGDLGHLTNSVNTDVAVNSYLGLVEVADPFYEAETPVVVGITSSTSDPRGYSKSFTKAEYKSGEPITFRLPANSTVAGVTISAPESGKSVPLSKVEVKKLASTYATALVTNGYVDIVLAPKDFDGYTGFGGVAKTATIKMGVSSLATTA
jgi:hypothetical protein